MALTTMYPGMTNSPKTSLASRISANDTSITVVDSSVLPEAPNIAVIGSSTDAEVIIYSGKNGNKLTGVLRGKGNTEGRSWDEQTAIARNFTIIDYEAICENIRDLESRKRNSEDKIDAASAMTGVLPVENGGTGETNVAGIKTLLGLAAMAYKSVISLVDDITGVLKVANGGTGLSSSPSMLINLASTTAANILAASPRPGVTGTLGVGNGGTGKATHTSNAVLTGNGTSAVNNVATASGALYATAANGAAKFGVLPLAQGGTGKTTAADARTALGITSIAVRTDYEISTKDLTAGTSALTTGKLYFVYE